MRWLAHLRFDERGSRGRRFPEEQHRFRNDFQRDRDRIVHARAFRRLENKTQVFPPGLSDHFRTRLTHTLEVAQIARTIAGALGLNEDLTEALALAHDLGHPPFAHAGEKVLDEIMRAYGSGFDHNLHALRIVDRLELRYARFPGLNLTFEVREGIVKHSRDLVPGGPELVAEYLPGLRPPLEAQLIDLADEIAYNTADLDDAFEAGLFDWDEFFHAAPITQSVVEQVRARYPQAPDRVQFHESVRQFIEILVTGLIEGTVAQSEQAGARSVEDVRHHHARLAAFSEDAALLNRSLKTFLNGTVYGSPDLRGERKRSMRAMRELFSYYLDHPGEIPARFRSTAGDVPTHQLICDYLAGMTDSYFRRVYQANLATSRSA